MAARPRLGGRRAHRVRDALVAFALSLLAGERTVAAQEEDTADHGSRAAKKGSSAAGRPSPSSISADYHAGAFLGTVVQDPRSGVLLNLGVGASAVQGGQQERLRLDYQYDPFTTKTFNFPEEDQGLGVARLTQGLHELDLALEWQSRWSRALKSELQLSGDAWFPDDAVDRRWSMRAEALVHWGKPRGPYLEVRAAAFMKKYPRYLIADRRIDQWGSEADLRAGYQWGARANAALGGRLELTRYLDARYDRLSADGLVERASESKRYLARILYASLMLSPAKVLRLSARYEYELNDATHYDRRVPARDPAGNPLSKFIPDYYDFARHRATLRARFLPHARLSLSALGELWFRGFQTYEARDSNNVWLGTLRRDRSLELGAEVAFRVLELDALGLQHGLFLTAFGSHLRRRSNMRREVSLATNFDVTRLFLGFELRPF